MERDPYSVLGVAKTATQEEIKDAYRKLAKSLHPDLNPGNKQAEQKFKEVASAYEILGDEKRRKQFDEGPKPGEGFEFRQRPGSAENPFGGDRHFYYETQGGPGEASGFYSQDFSFEDLFGAGRARRRRPSGPQKGEDELYRMEIELRDVATGGEKELTLPNGKRIRVKIPAGVTDGTRLRFAGQGGPGIANGPPGDIYVELSVRESAIFQRDGLNLELELPITLSEALNGAQIKVPTLSGNVMMNVPAGANHGTRLRVRGKGLPDRAHPDVPGDLFVRLRVVMPTIVDDELKKAALENEKKHPYDPRAKRRDEESSHAA